MGGDSTPSLGLEVFDLFGKIVKVPVFLLDTIVIFDHHPISSLWFAAWIAGKERPSEDSTGNGYDLEVVVAQRKVGARSPRYWNVLTWIFCATI